MNKRIFSRLLLCVVLFLFTFAGKAEKLAEYDESFHRSQHKRTDIVEFQGIKFGITLDEFKQLCEKDESKKILGDTTIDRGHRGRHRIKVYLKGKTNAGPILGDTYLFRIKYQNQDRILARAYFTPDDERLHAIRLYFPDTLWKNIEEIEGTVRQLYQLYGEQYGPPDYLSGHDNDDWGPQKDIALTKKNLNHPKKSRSGGKTLAVWCHHDGKWRINVAGVHFKHVKNSYQIVVSIYHNYTKGFEGSRGYI